MAYAENGTDDGWSPRPTAVLVGVPADKAVDHLAALTAVGFESSAVERIADVAAAAGLSVIIAPLADHQGDCGTVEAAVDRFPAVPVVALAARMSAATMRTAIRCGAATVVGLDEPVDEAAETVYQASLGFCRIPVRLLHEVAAEVPRLTGEQVAWLELLGNDTLTMSDVAQQIGWSRAELYRRLRPLYRSLGAGTRSEAVLRARQLGILA